MDTKKIDGLWFDVGLIKGTTSSVNSFLMPTEGHSGLESRIDLETVSVTGDAEQAMKKLELQPGTAYKFRVAGFNSSGAGSGAKCRPSRRVSPVSPALRRPSKSLNRPTSLTTTSLTTTSLNGISSDDKEKEKESKMDTKKIDGLWFDVGLIKGTTSSVNSFLMPTE